ncbi:MAG: histidine kinase, partial [Calditrichaeota bacterium]
LAKSLGGGTATVMLEDLTKADLVVLIGANPACNHPRLMAHLVDLKRRGGKVVVINPFEELGLKRFKVPSDLRSLLFGSKIADLYLQPHCGGDLAFLKAAAAKIYRDGHADMHFLAQYCNNHEAFCADLEAEDIDHLLEKSGISREGLAQFCETLADSRKTIFAWAMGITHHQHGVENVQMIANLALMRGMVGKPGAGLLPIRGHSNVQGVGTVGVVPRLKPAMAENLARHLHLDLPESPGLDTFHCMQAAHRGEMDFAVLLGGNLYAANPDLKWAGEALRNIPFTLFVSTTLNLGHIHGHGRAALILPVRTRDEEAQATSQESMFNFVRLSLGGNPPPHASLPSETAIFARVGKELLGDQPVPWSKLHDHREIRNFIAQTVPNMHPAAKLEKEEFTIPGRIFHQPRFNTENGKANLAILSPPDARPAANAFNLTTFRSEGQFNTIIYEDEDLYRGVTHRQVVFVNPQDLADLGLCEKDWAWVESQASKMRVQAIEAPIRRGNVAMYFPEANALVPGITDPVSRTPVFKRIPVRLYPAETSATAATTPAAEKATAAK